MTEKIQFLKENAISEHLFCTICSELYNCPQHLSCGHVFCSPCLSKWQSQRAECPECRKTIDPLLTHKDILISKMVEEVKVKCPFELCRWSGMLSNLNHHKTECALDPSRAPQWVYTTPSTETKEEPGGSSDEEETIKPLALRVRLYQSETQRDQISSLME